MRAMLLWKGITRGKDYRIGVSGDGVNQRLIIERRHDDSFGGDRWMVVAGGNYAEDEEIDSVLAFAFEDMHCRITHLHQAKEAKSP